MHVSEKSSWRKYLLVELGSTRVADEKSEGHKAEEEDLGDGEHVVFVCGCSGLRWENFMITRSGPLSSWSESCI